MLADAQRDMTITQDAFLTGIFGYPCYGCPGQPDPAALRRDLSALQAPAFVWCKASARDDRNFAALIDLGFDAVVDEITYARAPDAPMPTDAPAPEGIDIEIIGAGDGNKHKSLADDIGALAAAGLTTSRFHQDRHIPAGLAAAVKRQWAKNFFLGRRGSRMIVARGPHGKIAGFNQVIDDAQTQIIDLICTDPAYHRRGIGRALVATMLSPSKSIRVGSQLNNTTADAFYRGLGFAPVGTCVTMHWHAKSTPMGAS